MLTAQPRWLDRLLGLFFPDRCAGCGAHGALLCMRCEQSLQPYPANDPVQVVDISAVFVAFVFSGPLRGAIHQLKYRGRKRIGLELGALLGRQLQQQQLHADAVVAVPLHPQRLRERGFNQAELIAHGVAEVLQLPLLNNGLERIRATAQQACQASGWDRRANVQDAFRCSATLTPASRLLLIDDVLTTGATMDACAHALRQAGASQVIAAAVARSQLHRQTS